MKSALAVTDYIDSLVEADTRLGLSHCPDPDFFTEWMAPLPPHLLKGAVNFIVIAPLLELAGFYDPPFRLRSEASIRLEIDDQDNHVYQGRIDGLIVQENFWVILVEAKRTSFSIDVALPQALAYMAANPHPQKPAFALVSNGAYSMFIKLADRKYAFSDDFSLNRQKNELWDVLQIINHLKTIF